MLLFSTIRQRIVKETCEEHGDRIQQEVLAELTATATAKAQQSDFLAKCEAELKAKAFPELLRNIRHSSQQDTV